MKRGYRLENHNMKRGYRLENHNMKRGYRLENHNMKRGYRLENQDAKQDGASRYLTNCQAASGKQQASRSRKLASINF
jgi:hypothetical protein